MTRLTNSLDMEHSILLILGLAGIIITGAIAGILVLETTREKSK